jgi:hypothetical protein
VVLSSLALAGLFGPAELSGQAIGGRQRVSNDIQRRIHFISPHSGPIGSVVRVESGDMPSITPIRVGIGASRSGFEAYEELLTTPDGEFATTVKVPEWATWDRIYMFIVFDIYFQPIALSDVFHVTNAEGLIQRQGRVQEIEGDCTGFRDLDSIGYALVGEHLGDLDVGDEVTVVGRIAEKPACGMPNTIEVVRVGPRFGSD